MQPNPPFTGFIRFVWEHSPFYRRLYHEHGIRESDLGQVGPQDLPIVTKPTVFDHFDEIVTDPRVTQAAIREWLQQDHDPRSRFLDKYLVIFSSGSSGVQENVIYDETAWRAMNAAAASGLYPGLLPGGNRHRNAYLVAEHGHIASVTAAVNSSQTAFERLILTLLDPIDEIIAQLNAFQPDRLTSYPNTLGMLAEMTMAGRLIISPRDVVISSSRLTPPVEALIRQAWNPNIYDLYASAESLFMALKQPGQTEWKVWDELQLIEVLDAENRQVAPGDTGRVILTNWANRTMPLVRYEMTDYVICGENQPGNVTLRGFAGRTFDNLPIRLNDGRIVEIPSYDLAQLTVPGLVMCQFVSASADEVALEYCSSENLEATLPAAIDRLVAGMGGVRTKFSIERVDRIWNDASTGKVRLVRRLNDSLQKLPAYIFQEDTEEKRPVQIRAGGRFLPLRRENLDQSIPAIFERQVARHPESIALKQGMVQLTYAALNQSANRVAHHLLARHMDSSHPVALLFSHKPAMVVAMLGVLKAGGWYAPLDPAHPVARNTAILRETGAGLLLTDSEGLDLAREYVFAAGQIINLDETGSAGDSSNPQKDVRADTPACVLYTTGTTGQPKGVVLDHRAVLHRAMVYTNDYLIGSADRMALLQSYVFNASVREIYAALLNGAELHLYSLQQDGIHHLANWLEEEGITTLYMVPSTFRVFLATLKGKCFEKLRFLRLGGEAVLPRDVTGFQRHFSSGCVLANGLAATETGTISQYIMDHRTRIAGNSVPSGFPVQDKQISLLDDEGQPVRDGEIGEIVVSSAYMGPGYFPAANTIAENRSIHTGDMGYRMPDGKIITVGRKDWQVKLRGQRMNLLEIEQTLMLLENIADVAVLFQADEEGGGVLVAYIQPQSQPAPTEDEIRRGLHTLVPDVMVPGRFVFFDRLPRTAGGKVDRQALPPVERKAASAGPSSLLETPAEFALAEIWQALLDIEQVSADDNFFDLGGDSLLTSALMARIEDRFKRRLPLSTMIEHRTLRQLAGVVAAENLPGTLGLLVTIQSSGEKAPIFFLSGIDGEVLGIRSLFANMGREHPMYALKGVEFGDSARNVKTIEQIAGQYAREIRLARPKGPYILVGYSFGGHLALETARRLMVSGEPEPLLVLIDTYPPGPSRKSSLFKRIQIHSGNLRKLGHIRNVTGYLRDRFQQVYLRLLRNKVTKSMVSGLKAPGRSSIAGAQIALATYNPEPYSGKVVLLKASEREWYVDWDPMDAWKDHISGELAVYVIPGEHFSLIKYPHVIDLARTLQEVIG